MKAPLSVCRMVLILICDFMVMRLFAQMIPRLKIPVVFFLPLLFVFMITYT